MANELKIETHGNLTAPPELRFTPNGRPVCSFTVAQTARHYDRNSNEWVDSPATFLRVTAWGQMAENIAASELQQGTRVVVYGTLQQRSFETREGDKRTVLDIQADEVGTSMRYATVKVTKTSSRSQANGDDADVYQGPWPTDDDR